MAGNAVSPVEADECAAGVAFEVNGISKAYPGVQALRDVSLTFRAGEVHGLVGENGAGKSTLMAVASGSVRPDEGSVSLAGETTDGGDPHWMVERGVAMVHQEPALLPDLTVAENMRLVQPHRLRPSIAGQNRWAREHLAVWEGVARIDPATPARDLKPDERFVVEIARAFASKPSVLILDEPTEHLLDVGVAVLFEQIRRNVDQGVAVIYISHRIREVLEIADVVSVLRNGELRGTRAAADLTEDDLVTLIVGRQLATRFPAKSHDIGTEDVLTVAGLHGKGFDNVSLAIRRGEIVGLAGIEGQGQREVLRALAGLVPAHGAVRVAGKPADLRSSAAAAASGIAYLTNDRHHEGVLPGLTVRENLTLRTLSTLTRLGVLELREEKRRSAQAIADFGVRTPSDTVPIESLSGGNQQKVMIGRVLLSGATLLLVDEPSQGVDVGARADIYELLRKATAQGSAVLVLSSDNSELAGLCDRVLVFSRGQVVESFSGEAVVERGITEAAVTTSVSRSRAVTKPWSRSANLWGGRLLPAVVLVAAIVMLGAAAVAENDFYLTSRNFGLVLPMLAIIVLVALGQQFALLVGGIDLSVGPLMSVVVVTASYLLSPQRTVAGLAGGWIALLVIAVAVAFVNWLLISVFEIGPIIATLVTFTGLQGVALMIRETPGGSFSPDIIMSLTWMVGFVPVTLIGAVVIAVALELALTRTNIGITLRAAGSSPAVAARLGVKVGRAHFVAYLGASLFATLAAIVFLPIAGSGNAGVGTIYTLSSIGAVVLGGASIFGGRGSFVGTVLGAALILQINTVVTFLNLTAYWQQFILGALTIAAAAFYSKLGVAGRSS